MSTDEIENKLREDRRRIITLEHDVGALKVDMGKVSITLEHAEKRAEERHAGLKTAQLEIRDLIQRRIEMDQEREKDAREYRQERERAEREDELARRRWLQNLLTPQTVAMILAVIFSLLGIRAGEVMLAEETPAPVVIESE